MSEQPLHPPTAAASLITDPRTNKTVNPYTLRRWCKAHEAHLSDGANPPKDASRLLTDRDVEVLREAARLRGEGLTVDAINERLAGLSFAVVDKVDNPDSPNVDKVDIEPPTLPPTLQEAPEQPLLLPVALSSLQSRQDATDERVAAIQRQVETLAAEQRAQQRDAIYRAERRGATVALVAVGFLLLFAWLLVNGAPW